MSASTHTIPTHHHDTRHHARERLLVHGVVQGVGFRPFVYRLANQLRLAGWVRNTPAGVLIEIEGTPAELDRFRKRLNEERPPNCVIESFECQRIAAQKRRGFAIHDSFVGQTEPACSIPPDLATCEECLRQTLDPADRRYRYPFTNCTSCGPRYSIIDALPYDRPATTMQQFAMCDACLSEYNDPTSRRFHAQPNACPDCGPQLVLRSITGRAIADHADAIEQGCEAIEAGQIVAVKGIGGFHLIADARLPQAVALLRERKRRPTKPFAVMMRCIEQVKACCEVSAVEKQILQSPAAPIVLLRRRDHAGSLAPGIAPNNPYLGVMLAYTPLHHLMLQRLGSPIIATSGNLSDEPICTNDQQVLQRLASIADLILTHNRPIARPVDDSIVQVIDRRPSVLRRSRGYAPLSIPLPSHKGEAILAAGGQQKTTVGLAVNGQVTLSQHIGNLDTVEACDAYEAAAKDLCRLLRAQPTRVVADRHPDYYSTRHAERLGRHVQKVQHHAAHLYSAMAEHGLGANGSVLGVVWDGTGLGDDGTIWGGELLLSKGAKVERVGHIASFALPGGDAAARQPARSAMGVIDAAYGDALAAENAWALLAGIKTQDLRVIRQMIRTKLNTPTTTSVGRLFDAVAALLGLCQANTFEGEAAIALQFAAESATRDVKPLAFEIIRSTPLIFDWRPAVREIIERLRAGASACSIARAFHLMLAKGLAQFILASSSAANSSAVLTGGCFQNKLLAELCSASLRAHGITPLLHHAVPPNDGGLALGQIYAGTLAAPNAPERSC